MTAIGKKEVKSVTNNTIIGGKRAEIALKTLPERLKREIRRVCESRRGLDDLREIRVRAEGVCSVIVGRERVRLRNFLTSEECEATVRRLCDGALYAHRDSIGDGYISIGSGIRVGVAGVAKYDARGMVGVCNMRSLVFRIPTLECAFRDELFSVYREGVRSGMLIYSSPGVGKTTALRSLAVSLGSGRDSKRVCVIDERFEFPEEDFAGTDVDILGGYKRRTGLEIATRTMSPDVILLDELGGDDVAEVRGVVRCGVPIIATAHAGSYDELMHRESLSPLIRCGAFDVFVGISCRGGEYSLSVDRL